MSNGGGGAATNSGIDFQQRIAAFVLAHVLMDVKNYSALQLEEGLEVSQVRFETNDDIDDLVLQTSSGRVLIQAKRSLSLSDGPESDFSSVLKQFVDQYVNDNVSTDTYILATSSKSSQRITKELRKLTEAARLNEIGSSTNPLTKAEEEVLEKTRGLVREHFESKTGAPPSEVEFSSLFKRIRIALVDIEDGGPLESAILTLLSGRASVSPNLLWASLIALSISLAKDRLSIDRNALNQRMGKFIGSPNARSVSDAAGEFLSLKCQGALSAGREILVIKSFVEDADYMIVELYRFEDDGRKRLKFFENKVELLNGTTWDVIHRAATYAGAYRFLEEQGEKFSNSRVVLIPINTETNVDDEPYAKVHAAHCANIAQSLENPLVCLNCGDSISEDIAPFIEVDEEQRDHCVGMVHSICLRPIDRVLGVIHSDFLRENRLLKNFDYNAWFQKALRGQGLFGSMSHLANRVFPVAWKPDYSTISKGGWCIKINLDDGSARYVHERGRVTRCSEEEATKLALWFNEGIEKARSNRDPWCYTSDSEGFSTYSGALQIVAPDEKCLFCNNAEPVRYTRPIGDAYSQYENFYAPLAILLEKSTGLPISVDTATFLISNPLNLEKYIDNWRHAGIELPEFVVSIIETDDQFDKFVGQTKDAGGGVIVNPLLQMNGELSSGFIIENYYELIGDSSKRL